MSKKIAILTGGGDCPGLNAVIRAVVKSSLRNGWQVYGVLQGFSGLLDPENKVIEMNEEHVRGILHIGGTILGTTNRANPFEYVEDGEKKDVSSRVKDNFAKLGLDALICIGGDGTLSIANQFSQMGLPVIGIPKTIDNDLASTVITFGFDTAVNNATDALDKLHSTAESHERVIVVELMGRYAGWITLNAGVSGGADVILIPEIPFNMEYVCQKIESRYNKGRKFAIVAVAEGAKPKGASELFSKGKGEEGRQEVVLGGIGEWVANEIRQRTKRDTRTLTLGHLQRGGTPTTFDRLLSTRFGAAAVRMVKDGQFGIMVALAPPNVVAVPLEEAIKNSKQVPHDSDVVLSARQIGISFGD
ncbi:6-phosphofructokinase [Candidatus Uabimicrobium amorphum]|uniref:ATP-dependent 6-phosphofructokinase n=1 Tax=Uabimicrobium amorphum TaxID=2596890 RepID=A0A5S9F2T9_UABAM|nr:6-phosphofructokinase [Candidatus Uabimicrobium amorphum]BBM82714.1 ATP-dependent 6-phosphofructokinase [Candidatus Uabimicrobium amorphum]